MNRLQDRRFYTLAICVALVLMALATQSSALDTGRALQLERQRWESAQIRPEKLHFVQAIAAQIERNKSRYVEVSKKSNVPWQIIGAIHNLEASLSFHENLANGDPLTARTRHVPIGRPKTGRPPFSWEDAAEDSLSYDDMGAKQWGDIAHSCLAVELYNGPYYLKRELVSPYMHSWDNLYERGKIVADGVYSPTAVSQQCGAVPILKQLGYK